MTNLNIRNFTSDSAYGRNRDHLLASSPINVSKNGVFFSGSIGQDPNKVYLGLCRGDASAQFVPTVSIPTRGIFAECHSQKEPFHGDRGIRLLALPVRSPPPPTMPNIPPPTDTIEKERKAPLLQQLYSSLFHCYFNSVRTLTCISLLRDGRDEKRAEAVIATRLQHYQRSNNELLQHNKFGQGGFGTVYKEEERLLVSEFLPASSLNNFIFRTIPFLLLTLFYHKLRGVGSGKITGEKSVTSSMRKQGSPNLCKANSGIKPQQLIFHPTKRLLLNWELRYKIICGIARGIHYLLKDSRLQIIHRDLKADNILLDAEMNPRIQIFGMAKLFNLDQTHTDTSRILGTFFGVLVLEIITGEKISHFFHEETGSLPTYAWENWKKGSSLNVIDTNLKCGSRSEMVKCIHLGLQCVQEDIGSRPRMGSVVVTLSRCTYSLPEPSKPGFCLNSSPVSGKTDSDDPETGTIQFIRNEVSVSDMVPR
ncbi:hypothetical protein F3Y22_tig00111070pilonHSYRG00047 [Hibiscus syriacus]|uniref:non-specific serine/threonine protein kinase n=1 Tax=Hibiscus syriacus TaxID=106335 RepID=A0A6A2Z2U5_HIBSY|nr:hypothetical protein F3Y22_tig00111070pilonHSYRG00047 [Hibiscus syriacus]